MRLTFAFSSKDSGAFAKAQAKRSNKRYFAPVFCLASLLYSFSGAPLLAANAVAEVGDNSAALNPANIDALPSFGGGLSLPDSIKKDPKHVLAIVAGHKVTVGDLQKLGKMLEVSIGHVPEEKRYAALLGLYVQMLTVAQAAEKNGYDKTSEFNDEMALARDNVLQKIYFQKQVLDKVSDAEIKARYDKEIASSPKEEEIRARHILVKTKAEAQAIIDRLNKGAKFEDIAKKKSKDGSAAVGGDLGYFTRGQMVKPFEVVAFSLKPGQYTKKPVQTPFGWHVIKVEDKRLKQPPALDDIKDTLRTIIARERSIEIMKDLEKKYPVTYPDKEVASFMENFTKQMNGDISSEDNEED